MRIMELTDLHFGHPKMDLNKMISNLHEYAYPEIKKSQILLLCGDFFDSLLNINSDAGIAAIYIIDELLELATTYNVYLRVLRGTFSHDRYQNRLFVDRANKTNTYNDIPLVRTIDKIEIERFESLGVNILFCPDDQPQKDVTEAIIDVISANHLDQVDFMCCHGYWEHLLPSNMTVMPHDCLDFNRLKDKVKYHVFNGHVHHPGIWKDKIISGGSFERFAHGEEEDKGFYISDFDPVKQTSIITFIRNKKATPFISVDMKLQPSESAALDYVTNRIKQELKYSDTYDVPIYVRVIGDSSGLATELKSKYSKIVISEKHTREVECLPVEFSNNIAELTPITVDNLPDLIFANTKEKYPLLTKERIKDILNESGS